MEKKFLTYNMEVNGLWQEVKFSEAAIEEIFMPFLHELTDCRAARSWQIDSCKIFGATQPRAFQRGRANSCTRHRRLSLHGSLYESHES